MIKGKPLSISEKWAMVQHVMKETGYTVQLKCQGGLSSVVEMAIRSKVLIMMNINTDMEMCNRVRGEVVQIWVDPQEGGGEETSVQEMQYPPSCILIKMD